MGVGLGIFAFWLGVAAMAWQRGDAFVMNTISLQVLSVYGIAWMIACAATGHGWMKANALFALLTVPVLGLFAGTGNGVPGLCDRAGAAGCRAGCQAVAAGPTRHGVTP